MSTWKILLPLTMGILLLCSGCVEIECAYLPSSVLLEGWHENTSLRNTGSQFIGLEKWCGNTYEIKGKYPALLTVNTKKTVMLTAESELERQARETIEGTFQNAIELVEQAAGSRVIESGHETRYVVYDGVDWVKNESVHIIGEVWNCAMTGTSIICIGIAYMKEEEL